MALSAQEQAAYDALISKPNRSAGEEAQLRYLQGRMGASAVTPAPSSSAAVPVIPVKPAGPSQQQTVSVTGDRLAELRQRLAQRGGQAGQAPAGVPGKVSPVFSTPKPAKKSPLGGLMARLPFGRKANGNGNGQVGATPVGVPGTVLPGGGVAAIPAKKKPNTLVVVIGVIAVAVVLVLVMSLVNRSGSDTFTPTVPDSLVTPTPNPELVPPEQRTIVPQDVKNTGWMTPLINFLIVAGISLALLTLGDSGERDQISDAIAMIVSVVIAVWAPANWGWGGVLAALLPIGFATFGGGIDFSPPSSFILLTGMIGGWIANKVGIVQAVLPKLMSAPMVSLSDFGSLYTHQRFDQIWFPLLCYAMVFFGAFLQIFDMVRPSGDVQKRYVSFVTAALGLLCYYLLIPLFGVDRAWITVAMSSALVVGATAILVKTNAARKFNTTKLWGSRSIFDGAILFIELVIVITLVAGQIYPF